jgi:hypothetical protein
MPPEGFEPTVSADERPQFHALDRAATCSGLLLLSFSFSFHCWIDNQLLCQPISEWDVVSCTAGSYAELVWTTVLFFGGHYLTALVSQVTAELISVPISLIRVGHGWGAANGGGVLKKELPLFSNGSCFISDCILNRGIEVVLSRQISDDNFTCTFV